MNQTQNRLGRSKAIFAFKTWIRSIAGGALLGLVIPAIGLSLGSIGIRDAGIAAAQTLLLEGLQDQAGGAGAPRKQSARPPSATQTPSSQGNMLELPATSRQGGSASNSFPEPPLNNQQTLVLPAIFRGCWDGRVTHIDSLHYISGPPIAAWVTKTYRLCYQRSGSGPFEPTFSMAGLDPNSPGGRGVILKNVRGSLKVISTDGQSEAKMRAVLGFDECHRVWRVDLFGNRHPAPLRCSSVREVSHLNCRIESQRMRVSAVVDTENDGMPWARVTWHTDFIERAAARSD